ncbi:hypothetical protein IWX50DRAFT_692782 [Phyllosticta citricarpa]
MKWIMDFHRSRGTKPWAEQSNKTTEILLESIELSIRTDVYQFLAQQNPIRPELETFYLFRKHPVYCGLWKHKLEAHFHELGVSFASMWTASLHGDLHRVARRDNLWRQTARESRPVPEPIFYYARHIRFFFAKDARQYFKPSKVGIKPLATQAPLALIFLDRFARNSFQHEFTPDELKRIMEKTIVWSHDDFEVKGMRPWEVAFGLKLSRPSRSQAHRQAKDMNKTKGLQRLTVPELLRKMCNALEGEMFEMTFNYFRMHMQCWKVLQFIAKDSHQVLSAMDCFPMIDNAARLPYVAGMVFLSTMRNSNLFVAKMAPTKDPAGCAPILFVDTVNAIEAFIDNGEGAVVTGDPDEEGEDTDDDDDDETKAPAELPLNPNPIWRSNYEVYYARQRARYFAQFSPIEKLAKAGAIKSDEHSEKISRLVNALEKLGQWNSQVPRSHRDR